MQQEGHQPREEPRDALIDNPEFDLSLQDLGDSQSYCDECRRLVRSWPWAEITHQAPTAMRDIKCRLCYYIWRTLNLEKRIRSWEQNKLVTLDSFAKEDDPHRHVSALREPVTDIASDSSINGMRRMIEDCARKHDSCREQFGDFLAEPAELPRRVLQISSSTGHVRIYERAPGEKAAYATLSYTWGKDVSPSEKSLVTDEALSSLEGNEWVASDGLPQCFQDALELTRRLNLEYLWIDCLCLRGHDIGERNREISDFVHIFRNSSVCIRPANIESVHQSFLRKKGPYPPAPACTVRVKDHQNHQTVLRFTTKANDATSGMQRFDGPLRLGSWNLAEHYVSPRQITITTHNEPTFYCLHPYHSAKYPYFWAEALNESYTKHHYTSTVGLAWVVRYHNYSPNVTATWEQWWKMVTDIHLGAIERPEDRALMIDCIAQHPVWGTEYLNGLWKHRLRELLVWKNDGGRITVPAARQQCPLGARLLNAPTWSWASTSGTVNYHDLTYLGNWQFTAKEWVSGAPIPYAKGNSTVASKVYIYGKCVSVKTYRDKLDKSAPVYFSKDFGEEMRTLDVYKNDALCLLLLGQMDFGGGGNIYAAPSKGSSATDESGGIKKVLNTAKTTASKLASLTISEDQTSSNDKSTEAEKSLRKILDDETLGSASEITSSNVQTEPTKEETTAAEAEPRGKRRSFFDWIRSADSSGNQRSYRFPRPSSRITNAFSNKKPEQLGSFGPEKPSTKISEPSMTSTNVVRDAQDSLQDEDEPVQLGWRRSFEGNADSYPAEFMSSNPQEEIFLGRCTVAERRPKVSQEKEKDIDPGPTTTKLDSEAVPEKKKKKKYFEPPGVSWGRLPDSGEPEEMKELVLQNDNKLMVLRRLDENHYERLGIADQGPCTKLTRAFWDSVPKASFCLV